jgi:hypothetical protein
MWMLWTSTLSFKWTQVRTFTPFPSDF